MGSCIGSKFCSPPAQGRACPHGALRPSAPEAHPQGRPPKALKETPCAGASRDPRWAQSVHAPAGWSPQPDSGVLAAPKPTAERGHLGSLCSCAQLGFLGDVVHTSPTRVCLLNPLLTMSLVLPSLCQITQVLDLLLQPAGPRFLHLSNENKKGGKMGGILRIQWNNQRAQHFTVCDGLSCIFSWQVQGLFPGEVGDERALGRREVRMQGFVVPWCGCDSGGATQAATSHVPLSVEQGGSVVAWDGQTADSQQCPVLRGEVSGAAVLCCRDTAHLNSQRTLELSRTAVLETVCPGPSLPRRRDIPMVETCLPVHLHASHVHPCTQAGSTLD